MYMYGNTSAAFTIEPLNGCLCYLEGMKCSWLCTSNKMFRPYICICPGADPGEAKIGGVG